MTKQGSRMLGGIASIGLGVWLVFRSGCQHSLTLLEYVVENKDPELAKRITEIITNK